MNAMRAAFAGRRGRVVQTAGNLCRWRA